MFPFYFCQNWPKPCSAYWFNGLFGWISWKSRSKYVTLKKSLRCIYGIHSKVTAIEKRREYSGIETGYPLHKLFIAPWSIFWKITYLIIRETCRWHAAEQEWFHKIRRMSLSTIVKMGPWLASKLPQPSLQITNGHCRLKKTQLLTISVAQSFGKILQYTWHRSVWLQWLGDYLWASGKFLT